jgi:peptidoglycan/LPS O-acetylase OafA/YrhL
MSESKPIEQPSKKRFLFIDGLRGAAALLVTFYHLYAGGAVKQVLTGIMPAPIDSVLVNGWIGVEVFFVVSGFVIAHSLRSNSMNFVVIGNFFWRRFIRLAPPYWIAIFLNTLINYGSNFLLISRKVPMPGANEVLVNMLFLQELLGVSGILVVAWTLCLEVQFYAVFTVQKATLQVLHSTTGRISKAFLIVFVPLAMLSTALKTNLINLPIQGLFLSDWYAFFAGILLYWTLEKQYKNIVYVFYSYLALLTIILIFHPNLAVAVTVGITFIIYAVGKLDHLHDWLNNDWIQYFGKISYSLYLMHVIVGARVINIGYRFLSNAPITAIFLFFLGLISSILASHLLYLYIEKPTVKLGQRFKLKSQSINAV